MCFNFTAVFNMFVLLPFDITLHCSSSLHVMLVVVEKKENKKPEVGEPLESSKDWPTLEWWIETALGVQATVQGIPHAGHAVPGQWNEC